jgi:hypothetical protein
MSRIELFIQHHPARFSAIALVVTLTPVLILANVLP